MRPFIAKLRAYLPFLAILVCATGCTPMGEYIHNGFKVGPNYRRPAAPVAEDWIDANDKSIRSDDESLRHWWTVLGDPTLDALVANSVQQNLTLREAGFRVLQARAIRAIAVGEFFPQQQDMFGGYSRNALSMRNLDNAFIPERFFSNWNGGFELAWELHFWGRYRRAIETEPTLADAWLNLGVLLGDAGRIPEAIALYRQALLRLPGQALLHFNLAVMLEDAGQLPDALKAYDACLAIDPKAADAHFNAARLHEQLGHARDAIRHYSAYRRLKKNER